MAEPPPANAPKPCCVCAEAGGKHCTKCKSRHYCSKACQLVDWYDRGHKAQCRQLAAEFQDRLLDTLMPEKLKIKEEPPVVEGVSLAAGFKVAARAPAVLSAVLSTATTAPAAGATMPAAGFKAPAPAVGAEKTAAGFKAAPAAGATMTAAGFEAAPAAGAATTAVARALRDAEPDWRGTCAVCFDLMPIDGGVTFYECCCKVLCTACYVKCRQYDTRCPLCRTPAPSSEAQRLRRLQKNADEGNVEAHHALALLYSDGIMGLEKSPTRALQLYELAAAQGHVRAQLSLGNCYQLGIGVQVDFQKALEWYMRAADQSNPHAQLSLGNCYQFGIGVQVDFQKALEWYMRAADQSNPHAQFMVGQFYYFGTGVPLSYESAVEWYRLAAAQDHAEALHRLGALYSLGDGVAQDFGVAVELCGRAAALGHEGAAEMVRRIFSIRPSVIRF